MVLPIKIYLYLSKADWIIVYFSFLEFPEKKDFIWSETIVFNASNTFYLYLSNFYLQVFLNDVILSVGSKEISKPNLLHENQCFHFEKVLQFFPDIFRM